MDDADKGSSIWLRQSDTMVHYAFISNGEPINETQRIMCEHSYYHLHDMSIKTIFLSFTSRNYFGARVRGSVWSSKKAVLVLTAIWVARSPHQRGGRLTAGMAIVF